jgi:Transposase DDE domain group 1
MPEVYEFLEAERINYAIRLPANQILQHRIGYLLKRPVGRLSNEVRRFHANFTYQAGSWTKPRRVPVWGVIRGIRLICLLSMGSLRGTLRRADQERLSVILTPPRSCPGAHDGEPEP